MTPTWEIVEYPGFPGLRRLESDWRRLLATMPDRGPQHAYETHLAYFSHLSATDGSFTCLALTDGEQVRAICPLVPGTVEFLPGVKIASLGLACRPYGLLLDVICPAGEPQRELLPRCIRFLRRLPSHPALLCFDRVLEGSALWQCLSSLGRATYGTRSAGATDVIRCDRPFVELRSHLSKNFRGNLRKARNKLATLDDVRFASASGPPGLEHAMEMFLDVEASGWKGEVGTRSAIKFKPDQLAYHRQLAAKAWIDGTCEISTLHADGSCIAALFCTQGGAEYQIGRIAYDERYAHCAPGQLLLERTLQRCCENPDIMCVNLVSDAPWHRDWRPETIRSHMVFVGLGRWSGPALVVLLRLRYRIVTLVKRSVGRLGGGDRLAQPPRVGRGP